MTCSALATRDDDGKFIGADITLVMTPEISDVPDETIVITGAMDTQEANYVQNYFSAQIDALYEMMLQWAGKRVAQNLEELVNETAQRNVWPVTMKNGRITIELKQSDEAIYRALLSRAMDYAASMLGNKQVIREIEYVNKHVDPAELQYVRALGLDELYKDILK